LPPRAVARQLGIPVETVRTRLKRAMAQLRARLDRHEGGGRAAWCALLLPFTKEADPLAATAAALQSACTGMLLMTTKAKMTLVLTALGGLLLISLWKMLRAPDGDRLPAAPSAQPLPMHLGAASRALTSVGEPTVPSAERQPVRPATGSTTGSLLIRAV